MANTLQQEQVAINAAALCGPLITTKGPKDHIHMRILHSGSMAQDKEDSRNHGL